MLFRSLRCFLKARCNDGNPDFLSHRFVNNSPENDVCVFVSFGLNERRITRGDANNAPDAAPVPAENVIGKMELSVPYAGYLLDFAKSKKGLLVLVVIPGAIFIIAELYHLYRLVQQAEEEEERKKEEAILAETTALEAGSRQTV